MGKKLPKSRKHKKLKTIVTSSSGSSLARDLICDDRQQEMPRRLRELLETRNTSRKKTSEDRQDSETTNSTKRLKRNPYESDLQFIGKIDAMTKEAIDEARIKQKFDCELPGSLDSEPSNPAAPVAQKKMTSKQRKRKMWKEKQKQKKKLKKLEDETDEFSHLKDHVAFGEVALQPPELKAKPKRKDQSMILRQKKQATMKSKKPLRPS